MRKSKGKQPGEFKAEKANHQVKQELYNAILVMRVKGSSTCSIQGTQYELREVNDPHAHSALVLVKFGNTIELADFYEKDGLWVSSRRSGVIRRIQWQEILALACPLGEVSAAQ